MTVERYDLVVIGAGPAGEKGAAQAAYFGKRVAIVEKGLIGGASCNTGTIPSKTLRETSLLLSGAYARELVGIGIDLSLRRVATVADFLSHQQMVVDRQSAAAEKNLLHHHVTVYKGDASFEDAHTVKVLATDGSGTLIEGEKILIATGSSPVRPEMYDFPHERIWDSDEILEMEFMPQTMIIVGAGVIGSEYSCTFAALDIDVTLVDGRPQLLGFLDDDLTTILKHRMEGEGIALMLGDEVAACQAYDDRVEVKFESGREMTVDVVLVAAGRQASTETLALERAGLTPGKRGLIPVNEHFQTEVPHIYAAGDVVGHPALASVSMEQARLAMVHAFNLAYKKGVAPVLTSSVMTIPELSTVGKSEKDLIEEGTPYVVGRAYYDANARGEIIGETEGMLKLIFRPEDMRLLGVGVVGDGAADLIHVGMMALLSKATHEVFIEACFNYPTLGQLYKDATYDAMRQVAGPAA